MFVWLRRLRARIKYRHFDRDLAREIETHRALKAAEHRRHGAARDDARDAAARDLGNVTLMREDARGVWIAPWLQSVWQDLRYALAAYRRQPSFTIGALFVLALGTSLVTVAFSLAHATFLRPWQVEDPSSVVLLRTTAATSRPNDYRSISAAEFRYVRERARTADVFFTFRSIQEDLRDGERGAGRVRTLYVSDNYFTALRTPMLAGRGFTAADNDYRAPAPVAVLTERLWREGFNRNASVVGRTILMGRRAVTIIGVAATASFIDSAGAIYDLALPLASFSTTDAERLTVFNDPRQSPPLGTIGARIAAGASVEAMAAELTGLSAQFRTGAALPAVNVIPTGTSPIERGGRDEWSVAQLVLLALLFILLLACANVGNMLLARGLSRRREMTIRLALGAGRGRLVRQLLTEAGLLAIGAAIVAVGISAALPVVARAALTVDGFERPDFYAPTLAVFWFACGVAVLTTMACGLAPALRATGITIATMDRHGQTTKGVRLRRMLLATQIALATVLLSGAGLLTRGTTQALSIDPGFAINELHLVSFTLPRDANGARRTAFHRGVAQDATARGLGIASISSRLPEDDRFSIFIRVNRSSRVMALTERAVSPAFFLVSGVRLTAGRAPGPRATPREVVVSNAAARRLWPGEDPIGKQAFEGMSSEKLRPVVVVGVASDASIVSLAETTPVVYAGPEYGRTYLLTRDGSMAMLDQLRAIATAIEPSATVVMRPVTDQARDSMQMAVMGSWLAWSIGGLGLLLATVGAMGVFGYAVEERRREIGIRLALGAGASQVISLVLRTSQTSALIGVSAGLVLAMALAPLLKRYLYGLSPFDPVSHAQIAVILLAAAAIASWAPARRATRINPVDTLRVD